MHGIGPCSPYIVQNSMYKPEFQWLQTLKHNQNKRTKNSRCLEIDLDSSAPTSLLTRPEVYSEFDFKVSILFFNLANFPGDLPAQ